MYVFWWPPLDVSTGGGRGIGPQVNKFEQASSDDHQMSVVGGRFKGPMSGGGWGEGTKSDLGERSQKIPFQLKSTRAATSTVRAALAQSQSEQVQQRMLSSRVAQT